METLVGWTPDAQHLAYAGRVTVHPAPQWVASREGKAWPSQSPDEQVRPLEANLPCW